MPSNIQWPWRDGLAVVKYKGRFLMLGGWNWNGSASAFTPGPSCSEVWESVDGLTWTQKTNAPWTARHSMGYCVKDNKIWIWGGDPFATGSAPKDVWVYNETVPGTYNVSDWSQLTSDWGSIGGARMIFAFCSHDGSLFMAGGQTNFGTVPTMFTDIVRYNEVTNQWVKTGDLPIANFSTGIMVSVGSRLYIYGGGQYNDGGHNNFNANLRYSDDNGTNWTLQATLPAELDGLMYPNGIYHDSKLWFLNGATATNKRGLWFLSTNGQWVKVAYPLARHASALCSDGDNLWIVSGNLTNDVLKISKSTI